MAAFLSVISLALVVFIAWQILGSIINIVGIVVDLFRG